MPLEISSHGNHMGHRLFISAIHLLFRYFRLIIQRVKYGDKQSCLFTDHLNEGPRQGLGIVSGEVTGLLFSSESALPRCSSGCSPGPERWDHLGQPCEPGLVHLRWLELGRTGPFLRRSGPGLPGQGLHGCGLWTAGVFPPGPAGGEPRQ